MRHLTFRIHAIKRMFQRRITEKEVRSVLENGEVIEAYPEDSPYPSRLLFGWVGTKPLHVVAAENSQDEETIVITVYEPNREEWAEGFKRRKD